MVWLAAGALALAAPPLVLSPYHVIVLSSALILAIACLGLNPLLGYIGLLSLGHAAYFGIGAYAGAFLFTFADMMSLEGHLAAGVLAAAALGTIVGLLRVRATRIYFTILTLALAQVVHSLFVGGAAFRPFWRVREGSFSSGREGCTSPASRSSGPASPPRCSTPSSTTSSLSRSSPRSSPCACRALALRGCAARDPGQRRAG